QYSSESLSESDINWVINEEDSLHNWKNNQEEQLLDNIDWEDNETEYLHDYITLDNLEDYEKYLQDNDNNLTNSDNNTEQDTQKYKLFESQSQSFEGFNRKYAYEDLVKILKHLDFRYTVPISRQHTSSNSASTKPAYLIIPVDYIEYILNNSTIASNLYFGSGIVYDKKREFWH
ncbi:30673_t:CDS:2, partial [Racocetra persica]